MWLHHHCSARRVSRICNSKTKRDKNGAGPRVTGLHAPETDPLQNHSGQDRWQPHARGRLDRGAFTQSGFARVVQRTLDPRNGGKAVVEDYPAYTHLNAVTRLTGRLKACILFEFPKSFLGIAEGTSM